MKPKKINPDVELVKRGVSYFGNQASLAKAIGYSQQSVSEWLAEERQVPPAAAKKIKDMTKGFVEPPPVVVEKNIPLPADLRHASYARYPFATMEVGDSFLVTDPRDQKNIAVKATRYGKEHKKMFCTRTVPEGKRVWRVS